MLLSSVNISQEITEYLVDKAARRMCYQLAKKQAIKQITKQDARAFSSQCSKIVVNLYNLKSNTEKSWLGSEDKVVPPTCHKNKRPFQYTSSRITPKATSPKSVRRYSAKRIERLSARPPLSNQNSFCFPLIAHEDQDKKEQILREKKQRMSNLQNFFKRTEKQEKYKYKVQKMPKNPFTTDYNGDKLQIKKMSRTTNIDSSFVIDVSARIRDEKQQKQRLVQIQVNQTQLKIDFPSKQNHKYSKYRKTAPYEMRKPSNISLSLAYNRKYTKQSVKLQHLTLKDFQKDLNMIQKGHQSKFKKRKPNTTNISSIDCIRML